MLLLTIAFSLPGLIPAVSSLADSDLTASERLDANYIQVFHRIAHHLDPMRFDNIRYGVYALMFGIWLCLERYIVSTDHRRFWRGVVVTSVGVAVIGVLLGVGPRPALEMPGFAWRGGLLKFYPFRVADVLVPVTLCLTVAELMWSGKVGLLLASQNRARYCWVVTFIAFASACVYPASSRNPSRLDAEALADWVRVCKWVQKETGTGQLIHTPRDGWGFKWYGDRAEFFAPKDCPQEARGILEWFTRAEMVSHWEHAARKRGGYDVKSLVMIRSESNADIMITWSRYTIPEPPMFVAGQFAVIDLTAYDVTQSKSQ